MNTKELMWVYKELKTMYDNTIYRNKIRAMTIVKHMNRLSDTLGLAQHWKIVDGSEDGHPIYVTTEYTP